MQRKNETDRSGRSSSELKNDIERYTEFIKLIELNKLVVEEVHFKRESWELFKNINVNVSIKKTEILNEIDSFIRTRIFYNIELVSEQKIIMSFDISYLIFFISKEVEKANKYLEDEKIKEIFLKRQLNKIAWSYLRNDFQIALTKVGFESVPLPLLR